jgi:hypothetical protein
MIRGLHAMFYTTEADELRAFLRDKLQLPWADAGDGWLIFKAPEADLGCHPAEGEQAGVHDISFYCDDIHATVGELESRGVEFTAEVTDAGYGLVTYFAMPGGLTVQHYQPHYTLEFKRRG